jgi:hypothetical protein
MLAFISEYLTKSAEKDIFSVQCDFCNNIFVNSISQYQGRCGMQKNKERILKNAYRHSPENYVFVSVLFYMCVN